MCFSFFTSDAARTRIIEETQREYEFEIGAISVSLASHAGKEKDARQAYSININTAITDADMKGAQTITTIGYDNIFIEEASAAPMVATITTSNAGMFTSNTTHNKDFITVAISRDSPDVKEIPKERKRFEFDKVIAVVLVVFQLCCSYIRKFNSMLNICLVYLFHYVTINPTPGLRNYQYKHIQIQRIKY